MKLEVSDYIKLKFHLDTFEIDELDFLVISANSDYSCESRKFTNMIKASIVRFINNGGCPVLNITQTEYIDFLKLMNQWTTIDMERLKYTHKDKRFDIAKYCIYQVGGNYYGCEFMGFIQSLKY